MNRKKKAVVLFVPGFPANEQDTTCIPFLQQFCLPFSRIRPEIELLVITFQYPFKRGSYVWNGIKVYSAGGKRHKYNRRLTWIRVFMEFLKIRKDCTVTVINSFWMTECAFAGQWIARLFNTRHVVYVAGQDALKTNKYLSLINFSKMKIIAMSESLVNHFYESTGYKIPYTIPAGIDVAKIKLNEGQRIIDILGVGALIPLKNYLLFIEIIDELKKEFPGIKTSIIGKGEQEQILKEKIKAQGFENTIELTGELPHPEVFTYMQKSKILLHTSGYEGQSTVITEALANGVTVVCFNVGRTHADGRVWVCNSKREMCSKLKELLSVPLIHHPLILQTNDNMVREFFKIYEI